MFAEVPRDPGIEFAIVVSRVPLVILVQALEKQLCPVRLVKSIHTPVGASIDPDAARSHGGGQVSFKLGRMRGNPIGRAGGGIETPKATTAAVTALNKNVPGVKSWRIDRIS